MDVSMWVRYILFGQENMMEKMFRKSTSDKK